ncbi:hypothetical protein TrVFT333_005711 [Trichoderma virens FT-333]|nr:hypothetical protein TrVFT333_005711 [Trichoderma virens FT-333]
MSTPNNDKNCTSRNQDKTPATDIASHPTFSPASSPNNHNTTAPEPQQSDTPVLLQRQQHPRPASTLPITDGTPPTCPPQNAISATASAAARCKNAVHAIDAAAVDWDVPPNVRKRKRQAMGSGEETPLGSKRQKAGVRQRRSRGQRCGREVVASSVAGLDGAAQTLDGEVPWNREYGHVDNMEPRLSVAPASYYPSVGQAQHTEAISPKYSAHYELETPRQHRSRKPPRIQPPKPLDHCLRDELQAVWTSRAFIAQDPDPGRRYRRLLAAAYFASACLGLEPRENAAREWLCAEERRMREMGCEPTKTAQLLDFLQEVGIWYLRQAQR